MKAAMVIKGAVHLPEFIHLIFILDVLRLAFQVQVGQMDGL